MAQGLWRHPDAYLQPQYTSMQGWLDLARTAERGKLDTFMFADGVGVGGFQEGDIRTPIREGTFPRNDPSALVAAMAVVTHDLGFVFTSSIVQDHPFHFARRVSTLDHITGGRIGWNVVTSFNPSAFRNFGFEDAPTHSERYAWAQEYMEVVYKLWEGSWDDQAMVHDVAGGIWGDPDHVRPIDHVGARYSVTGPHMCEPSPQRTPVIVQAGSSDEGRSFAAQHAELQYIGSPRGAREHIEDVRARTATFGRSGGDVGFLPSLTFIVGSTEAEARERSEEFDSYLSLEASAAKMSGQLGVDLTALDTPLKLDDLDSHGIKSMLDRIKADFPPGATPTPREILLRQGRKERIVGTPEQIADTIERQAETGITGFNIALTKRPGSLDEFVDQVVPVLQDRGLAQREYSEGTLRKKLFGRGDRLPDTHPAAAYRRAPLIRR